MTRSLFFVLAGLLLFIACQSAVNSQSATDTVVDDYGRKVCVPTHPKRVVSVSPAVTEILFALGAGDMLVGRTDYCNYPAQAATVPSIGGISNLNVEHVVSLKPELIISGSMVPQATVSQFEKLGIPLVCVIEKSNFQGLYDNISQIGQLVGRVKAADSLNRQLKELVAQSVVLHQDSTLPTVYYVVGFGNSGNFTAGGNTFINDIITMAGGRNIAADMEGWSYSLESLMMQDPDYILIRAEDAETFCHTSPYNRLSAVKAGRVVALESGMIDLQVPRNVDALVAIAKAIH